MVIPGTRYERNESAFCIEATSNDRFLSILQRQNQGNYAENTNCR